MWQGDESFKSTEHDFFYEEFDKPTQSALPRKARLPSAGHLPRRNSQRRSSQRSKKSLSRHGSAKDSLKELTAEERFEMAKNQISGSVAQFAKDIEGIIEDDTMIKRPEMPSMSSKLSLFLYFILPI